MMKGKEPFVYLLALQPMKRPGISGSSTPPFSLYIEFHFQINLTMPDPSAEQSFIEHAASSYRPGDDVARQDVTDFFNTRRGT
jgi:hypothetical protein